MIQHTETGLAFANEVVAELEQRAGELSHIEPERHFIDRALLALYELRRAHSALATLTPREQRMEESLRHALTFIENRYSDLSPEKRATVSHIRSALSLQDKT